MPRPRQARGRPTDYDWELSFGNDLARAAGAIVQFEIFTSDTAETLMRVRGDIMVALDISGASNGDALLVAWGVIRSAAGSSDVGVSPITEGGANFLAYGVAHLIAESTLNLGLDGSAMLRWDVDSKAMRKLRENESLYLIFQSVDVVGAPLANYTFALRGLTGR